MLAKNTPIDPHPLLHKMNKKLCEARPARKLLLHISGCEKECSQEYYMYLPALLLHISTILNSVPMLSNSGHSSGWCNRQV